jgi:hypothetical protein
MSNVRRQQIIEALHEPPVNELPVVLATPDMIWRGDGIVVAIPSLLIYTTGAELLILSRTRHTQMRDIKYAQATGEALQGLRANGIPVELLGGEHHDHGFTYRAWIPFLAERGDITFDLEWPGVERATRRVPGIREAAAKAVLLWELS